MTNHDQVSYSCSFSFSDAQIFESLTNDEMNLVIQNSVRLTYKKGEIIFKQGTFATHLALLTSGLTKIYIADYNNDQNLILKILPPVNLIGISFLSEVNSTFFYSVQAYVETTIELIDINILRKIIRQNALFATRIIDLMCEHTLINYGRFFCMTHKQTYGRMADVLLCLSIRIYKRKTFPLQLSRKELAELAGMSVESTVRILAKFKEDGLIKTEGKTIEILQTEKLLEISKKG